jgi:tRNA pseudouridine38-40 synthase
VAWRAGWAFRPLDADAMHAAAQALIGEHDFSAFRAAECQAASPVRKMQAVAVDRRGELLIVTPARKRFLAAHGAQHRRLTDSSG